MSLSPITHNLTEALGIEPADVSQQGEDVGVIPTEEGFVTFPR